MDKITEILNYYSESHNIDFKLLQYPIEKHDKKNEILKDISAMANHLSDDDKYIIIGVKRKKSGDIKFQDVLEPVDQAAYQQFLDGNIEPPINFEYNTTIFEGHPIAYFKISNNTQRPYLFKKNVQNSINPQKCDFRVGDGFIRVGTSTEKICRTDFEKIYEKRYKQIDRKSDIIVTPFIGDFEDEVYSQIGIKYLDFNIENLSNQSINLDIKVKIHKSPGIYIVPKNEFEQNLLREKRDMFSPIINTALLQVSYENHDNFVEFSRVKLRTQAFAVSISQNDTENEIFGREITTSCEGENRQIRGEIIIRSDSFTDGVMIQKFEF
jgi:hypothetical protein